MRINIASFALIQLFARCPQSVNGEESLMDLIQTFKRTANNDQRVVLDDGKNIPDAKDKESFKDLFQGLKLKTKNGKKSGSAGKRAPKGKGSTSTAATCTLCENGQSVGNPSAFAPFLANVTCSKLDSYLRSFVLPYDFLCYNAQSYYSGTCGCCPGICPNGEKISYPNRIVPFDVNDNGIYDDTCADLNMFFKTNVGNYDCGIGSYIASEHCGCTTFEKVCTPCYNNAEMPNLNKVAYTGEYYYYGDDFYYYGNNVTDDYFPTTYNVTCGDIAIDTLSFYDSSSWSCADQQAFNTIPCDCPSIPPSSQSSCSLCFANETLSSSLDPVFGVESCRGLNAYAVIHGSILYDNSCDTSMLINELLANSTMNGRATCCIPKTTAAGPSGKGTQNKAKIENVDWKARKKVADAVVAKMLKKKSMAKKMKHSS